MRDVFDDYRRELSEIEDKLARESVIGRWRRRLLIAGLSASALALAVPLVGDASALKILVHLTNSTTATAVMRIATVAAVASVLSTAVALATRRWMAACVAFYCAGLSSVLDVFAIWSHNTLPDSRPPVTPALIVLWALTVTTAILWGPVVAGRPLTAASRRQRPSP